MRIPKTFTVNETTYTVKYKWNLRHAHEKVDGLSDFKEKTLYIERSLARDDKWWTFRHEWKHIVFHEYGCGFNSHRVPQAVEEEMILALEQEDRVNFNIRWKLKR